MSSRNENLSLIEQLRDYEARLLRLETQDHKIKKNDIRLSDTVVTADSPNDRLCLENLVTNKIVCIGEDIDTPSDPTQAQWSFSGDLTGHTGDTSPGYLVERDTTARQILVSRPFNKAFTGTVAVCVHFSDDAVQIRADLVSPNEFVVKEINVPLSENDDIYVELVDDGTDAEDISVFVRFGTTTVAVSTSDCAI